MSASMLCLLVSLVTYIRFSELRNSAGKNNMFLCTSLLLAQASLLASSYFSGFKYICIALGMSTHFLWLWNFAWTFMCNFRILQVFTAQVRIPQTPEDQKRVLAKNIVLTLILPTVSVAAVVISSQILTQGQKIGYGELTCLIDSSLLLGVFLITPLSVITVCNVAFFIATVVKIYTISRSVTQQDNFSTSNRQLSVVYVKLSLMTGAFWLFAIVGEATDSTPLQYSLKWFRTRGFSNDSKQPESSGHQRQLHVDHRELSIAGAEVVLLCDRSADSVDPDDGGDEKNHITHSDKS
ncbi:uncharacterized protein LOC131951648 [Physella acuta]|uniref:uncharacterized protein LOC131951648 n=1 Tax=Physella acuta TaxID=109671 RepID=UPI0027DC3842|nr:uncharacterized protein LOC131951648 [Physella acuta]